MGVGHLARAATESAIHASSAKRFPPHAGGGPAVDRSYSTTAADRSYTNAAAERSYSTASDRGYGGYGASNGAYSSNGGGHGGGGDKWQHKQQQQHDKSSPRSSLSGDYEPDTPGRDAREEPPPRLARYGGGGGVRRGQYGRTAPWDQHPSSSTSSLDGGLLDARA